MTKRTIRNQFIGAIVTFCCLIAVGIGVSVIDHSNNRVIFSTFKDLLPLVIGIAAAWLGFCVQRRSAYQQQLRALWSKLVEAVQSAIQYTTLNTPTQQDHNASLLKLSVAIDEVRGVFCNIDESKREKRGYYPFEPIKDIYGLIENLGYGDSFKANEVEISRKQIFALWSDARSEILKEFDREEPTFPHSHWKDIAKGRVYETHDIPKKIT